MTPPTEQNEKLLTQLESMRSAAYKSFSDRREYEWKFCIALWTTLLVYVSALVIGPVEVGKQLAVPLHPLFWGTLIAAFLTVAAHVVWTAGMARANAIDTDKVIQLTESIRVILDFEWNEELKKKMEKTTSTRGSLEHWSHQVEVAVTLLLAIIAVSACLAKIQ